MLYSPRPTGLFDPVEVEVVEIDFVKNCALVLMPMGSNTLANVFLREEGKPEIEYVRRTVCRDDLKKIPR